MHHELDENKIEHEPTRRGELPSCDLPSTCPEGESFHAGKWSLLQVLMEEEAP